MFHQIKERRRDMRVTEYLEQTVEDAKRRIIELEERRKLIDELPKGIADIDSPLIVTFFKCDDMLYLTMSETEDGQAEHAARTLGMRPQKPTYFYGSWSKVFKSDTLELTIHDASEPLNCKLEKVVKEVEVFEVVCPEFNRSKLP
jgi:hypothetical protein